MTVMRIYRFILVVIALVMTLGLGNVLANQPTLMVRVAIARDAQEVDLMIEGSYKVRDMDTRKLLLEGKRMPKTKIHLLDKGFFVGGKVLNAKRLDIQPSRDASIIINNRRFRGEVIIIRTRDDRMTAVNVINIEDYVKGVLYHEVSHRWPIEALKSQAVATRTYAIYKMGYSSKGDFDVTNDIYSQVYGGQESERYRTGLAVKATSGLVLTYKGKILPAYFHATCAGMTEDSSELWNIDLPPLEGVPCAFCTQSPHMNWKKNFRLKDIQDKLKEAGKPLGLIKDIEVVGRNRSDRVKEVKITDRGGKSIVMSGKDFRELIGPNVLRSNKYEINMLGYYVDFIGHGWGHGVGLCQWGAKGMSDQQFNFKQILNYYYPHSVMVDYHSMDNFKQPAATPTSK